MLALSAFLDFFEGGFLPPALDIPEAWSGQAGKRPLRLSGLVGRPRRGAGEQIPQLS